MPNSPTIVSAELSDKELQDSINKMVANFDKGLQTMLEHSNEYVGKIQESLQKIGNTNFGAKSSNDGGVAKRTKSQNAETDAVEKNIAARDKQIKKNQEVKMSFDQMQTALEKATRLPSEMRMPDMAKSARESFQAFYKGFNEQARKLDSLIKAEDNRLASAGLGRFSAETQAQLAKVDASIDQTRWKMNFLYQEEKRLNQEALRQKVGSVGFEQAWLKKDETKSARVREGERLIELEKERQRIIASDPTVQQLDRNIEQTRAKIQQLLADEKRLHSESLKQTVGSSEFERLWNQKYQARDQRIAEQEKLIQLEKERQSLVAVDPIRTQLANVDELRAKHEKVLGVMRDETTTNNKVVESQQQVTSSTQQTTQAAQRYTEEIRKQAQAIRESKQWKEKGYTSIGDKVFYDPERSVASAKNRLSLEEQIILAQKKESEAAAIAAQEAISHAQAQKQVEEAAARTAQILETMSHYQTNVNKMQQDSTKLTSGRYGVGVNSFAQFDDLQVAISRVIGVEHQQIKIVNESYDSYKRLSASLSQLKAAYNSLNESERNSDNGRILVQRMQVIERSMQKIQAQAARPISLGSVMGLSEKTIDDIAYKMRQLASYRSGLNVETQVKEIEQVNKKYAQLQKNMNDIMQKNTDMIASNTALGRSWNYMKNRLAFYFTVGASTTFVKNLIDIRSQYELLERSIGILFDSMQTGSKIFSELNQMAIKSPFTTMELGSAAKQLSAYNIAAKDVVDTTRRLADMAAAVGIPIERLTYALGQIKSYGYLNSRDARMFANAGIPLIQNLADMYTKLEGRLVSIGDVYDRIKKKQVSFEDTLKVVHEMTDEGGRFFNFQEKAADTLKVRLANLTLAWNNMLNNMGKSNQGVLTSGLGVLKEMFENWRKIENIVLAIATNFGAVKAVQLLILLNAKGITKQMALQEVLGKKLGTTIYGIARNLKMLAVNPMTWLTIAITAVTYLSWKFWDLTTANENFNKSIADGTKENIASIDKFFDKYREDIESVGSMNTTDQEKMWERVREEIEKTTKNAQQYIDILEKIPELDKRVSKASGFLEQEKVIQEELNKLAQHGYFNIGGGFADDSYAEALTTIDKYTGEMIRKYGTYEDYIKAFKNEFQGFYDEFRDVKFSWNINEEIDESVKHFKKLESLNWGRILSGGTDEEKLARIRDTFMSLRDNFFATEEMQNAGAEAQALYNRHMDYWITSVAKANGLIKELTANGKTYSAEDVAAIEERRTEWELFFSYLSDEERRTMDYLVKTNQTGGEEFKKLWDTMADSMRKSNATAYRDLQKKIAELRETPDIVINVVYREMRDKLDEQQKAFEDRWIRPKDWSVRNLSAEKYMEEETANRTKYGRLMRKTEEDNVEWEERLGKEYQENGKKIKSLNAQLQNKNNLSEADRKQKEKDLNLYKDLNKAIDDIGKAENFNYNQFKKGGKGGSKKDPLLDALKQEISLVEKLQSDYDKLSKSGASQADALDTIRGAYGKTIRLLNAQLGKYGLPQLDISQLITGKDPNKALAHFKQTLDTLVSKGMLTLERSKELEAVVEKFTLSAKTYNLDMITKGLNNELGKLKDEYELALELDADPELGNMFADWMGIDTNELPRTFQEVVRKAQQGIDKVFAENNRTDKIDIASMLNKESFDKWVKDSGLAIDSELVKAVEQFRQYLHKTQVDENKKMTDEWSKLVEKYGDLQAKILKIYKDSLQEQIGIVRKFGDSGEVQEALDLSKKINLSQDPAEIARLQEQLANIIKSVVARNPQALNISTAVENKGKSETAKATWEDFKNSELYTMTFEDMANNSTRAIQLIMDKLEGLKDKVKEDPASMKALIKSLEDAQKELNTRDPFGGVARSLRDMSAASQETKAAQEALWRAEVDVEQAQQEVDNAEDGTPEEQAAAQQKLADAVQRRAAAQVKLTQAENKGKKAQENLKSSLQGISNQLGNVQELFGVVSKLFRAGGDDETADAIDAISEGFTIMTTVIMGVVAAMIILQSTVPWLLAIAAALSVVVGLVSFLSGNSDKKIVEQIKDSEHEVKKLENSYKNLEYAIEQAYGMAEYGARRAAIANRQLQLVELQRQLRLEQSRDSKHRDEDRILELKGQIIDLRNEISQSVDDITNDLLGISSVGDMAEELVSSMIEAFRQGEDYMKQYDESFEKMIDNMIMKAIVSRVVGDRIEQMWNQVKSVSEARGAEDRKRIEELTKQLSDAQDRAATAQSQYDETQEGWWAPVVKNMRKRELDSANAELERIKSELAKAEKDYAKAIEPTKEDIDSAREMAAGWREGVKNDFEYWMGVFGIDYGQDAESKQLSSLQQGIQSVTETTAGAIEAYMNGVSQQVYLHSDLLTQIRDAVVGFDIDVQTASLSQILLQLQTNYIVMQSMHSIMEGWTTPSGQGIRVELIS